MLVLITVVPFPRPWQGVCNFGGNKRRQGGRCARGGGGVCALRGGAEALHVSRRGLSSPHPPRKKLISQLLGASSSAPTPGESPCTPPLPRSHKATGFGAPCNLPRSLLELSRPGWLALPSAVTFGLCVRPGLSPGRRGVRWPGPHSCALLPARPQGGMGGVAASAPPRYRPHLPAAGQGSPRVLSGPLGPSDPQMPVSRGEGPPGVTGEVVSHQGVEKERGTSPHTQRTEVTGALRPLAPRLPDVTLCGASSHTGHVV